MTACFALGPTLLILGILLMARSSPLPPRPPRTPAPPGATCSCLGRTPRRAAAGPAAALRLRGAALRAVLALRGGRRLKSPLPARFALSLPQGDAIGNPPGQIAKTYNTQARRPRRPRRSRAAPSAGWAESRPFPHPCRADPVASRFRQVGAWEKAGYAQFQAAWPINGFTVPVALGGTDREPVPLLAFEMEPRTDVVAPVDDNGETPYTEAQWFSGSVNLWAAGWPTNDQYYTLDIPGPAPSVTLESYQCTNVAFAADGGACAAPLPGGAKPPPPGGRRMRAQRRRLQTVAATATTTALPAATVTALPLAATTLPAATAVPAATVAAASGLALAQPLPAATVTPLPAVPVAAFAGVYSGMPAGGAAGAAGGPPGGGNKWPPGKGTHPPGYSGGGPPHYGTAAPKASSSGFSSLLPRLEPPPAPAVSDRPCTQYYRQVQFPAVVNLIATPPHVSVYDPTPTTNWTVGPAPNGCGTTFQNVQIPVTAAIYGEDIATMPWPGAPPAWCGVWGTLTAARPNGTTVTLRSAEDPVAQGLLDTHCTYHFGLPKQEYRLYGARFLVLPGTLISGTAAGMIMCMVARRRAAARVARGRAATEAAHEGTPLAPPGVFVPPSAQSAARAPAGKPAPPPGAQRAGYGSAAGKGFQRVSSAPRGPT